MQLPGNRVISLSIMSSQRPAHVQNVCDQWACQMLQRDRQRREECERLHGAMWSDPSKSYYDDCVICNPPEAPTPQRGRKRKHIAYTRPPTASEGEAAKRAWFAQCMQLEGRTDEYSSASYTLATKRAKRDPDKDNEQRSLRRVRP